MFPHQSSPGDDEGPPVHLAPVEQRPGLKRIQKNLREEHCNAHRKDRNNYMKPARYFVHTEEAKEFDNWASRCSVQ